jgi:RimJ/RimL family protein N-acetyltransferase
MYRKTGFVEEGIQREARLVDNEWHDVILMGILEKENGN